ncbi:uncharacterized protein PAE49_020233 isoform 2-T2 [Odontesthes bonariensis]
MSQFPQCNGLRGPNYLQWVSDKLSELRGKKFGLVSPHGATLTVGPLEDTMYKDNPARVNGCGKFYLPTTVKMQVIGYVEGTPYPCDQLVLMTSEEQKIYGYDGEELHLVASSLQKLHCDGICYPASESFYRGEAFKDMTDDDWEKVRQGPVGKRLDAEHHKLVESQKSRLLANLKISSQKKRCHQKYGKSLPDNILSQFVQKGGS